MTLFLKYQKLKGTLANILTNFQLNQILQQKTMAVPFYVPEGDGDGHSPNNRGGSRSQSNSTTGNNTTSTSASSSQQQSPNDPNNNNNQHHNHEQLLQILCEALYRVGGSCFSLKCFIIIGFSSK